MTVKYMSRILDNDLEKYLTMIGAILIVGPKWCGKTTTAQRHANSVLKLQDKDNYNSNMMWADLEPSRLLKGDKPRLIDEWQVAPVLWDSVRTSVDETDGYGLYILTGSTVVDEDSIMHSGTGRIHRLLMRPMSLYESGESNGQISIMDLFNNPNININDCESTLSMDDLIFAACRGGWPDSINQKSREGKLFVAYSYLENICNTDVSAVDGVKKDPDRVRLLLRSIARNNSTLAKDQTIIDDMNANFMDISRPTYYSYVDALKRLFVLEDNRGWSPNIKSKSAIRSGNKKVFIDPSIAVAALNANPESMENDLYTFGFIFENLCIRDLSIYTNSYGGKVSYYHDKSDLEIDCVVHLRDGRYALIECKLGSKGIEEGANNLIKINRLIENNDKLDNPSFLAVLTGGKYAYTRKDGVKVIPIGCLR
ncbi:MAG: ATP-binding protein [Methanosphaera sp.]|nr:ATP-binding protein [Methanosphaera sp.]